MPTLQLNRIEDYLWEIPRTGDMRVPGRIYATDDLIQELKRNETLEQVANVATFSTMSVDSLYCTTAPALTLVPLSVVEEMSGSTGWREGSSSTLVRLGSLVIRLVPSAPSLLPLLLLGPVVGLDSAPLLLLNPFCRLR